MIKYKSEKYELEFENVDDLNNFLDRREDVFTENDFTNIGIFIQNMAKREGGNYCSRPFHKLGSFLVVMGMKEWVKKKRIDWDGLHKEAESYIDKQN